MRIPCLFLALVLPGIVLTGQATSPSNRVVDVKILGTDSLVKGIYRSFKEFQDNNPSIRSDFLSVYSKNEVKEVCGDMSVTCLHILDRDGTLKPFTRYHWGLCDGRHVFICHYGRYYELSLDGKYCRYKVSGLRPSTFGSSFMSSSVSERYVKDYLLNAANDKIVQMSVPAVTRILRKENSPLLSEFQRDMNKKVMQDIYIDRLNKTFTYRQVSTGMH